MRHMMRARRVRLPALRVPLGAGVDEHSRAEMLAFDLLPPEVRDFLRGDRGYFSSVEVATAVLVIGPNETLQRLNEIIDGERIYDKYDVEDLDADID